MKGKKYSAEQIVTKLREAEVLLVKGMTRSFDNARTARRDHWER